MPFIKPLVRYFQFTGRAGRAEFWQYTALVLIISLLLSLMELRGAMEAEAMGTTPLPLFSSIFGLLTFIPSLAVTFRRLHDRNKSGWYYGWLLVAFIPAGIVLASSTAFPALWPLALAIILGIFGYSCFLIYELAQPGDYYDNDFGEPDTADFSISRPLPFSTMHEAEAPPTPMNDIFSQIERVAQLHTQGALTDDEFAAQKSRLLGML
jgi:uncharacterized membrane protein YhaH (DUF805 family)